MSTALDLIKDAARKIGVKNIKSSEITDALRSLNVMIDAWNAERLTLFQELQEQFTLTTASSYTIGSGGAFDTTTPQILISAFFRDTGGSTDYPIRRFVDKADWDQNYIKTLSGIPEIIWYDTAHPLGTINIFPQKAGSLFLTSAKQLTPFATTSTVVSFPPGYEEAFINNLAIRLAPEFQVPVPQEVMMIANNSLGSVRDQNRKSRSMILEPAYFGSRLISDINRGF